MQIKETQRHGLEEQRLVCDGIAQSAMQRHGWLRRRREVRIREWQGKGVAGKDSRWNSGEVIG